MTAALLFIVSHWRTALVASAFAAICVFAAFERAHVAVLEFQLSAATTGLKACRDGTDALRSLVTTQNAAVDKLKRDSDAQAVAGVAAAAASADALTASNARLALLAKEKVPADCKGAVQWAASKAKALSKGWGNQ